MDKDIKVLIQEKMGQLFYELDGDAFKFTANMVTLLLLALQFFLITMGVFRQKN